MIIMHRCNYKSVQIITKLSVCESVNTRMFWGRLFYSLITEGKKENLKLSTLVFS